MSEPYPDAERLVRIELTEKEWEHISLSLADVLCWHAGFRAGRSEFSNGDDPCNLGPLRSLNLKIKDTLP